MRLWTIGLLPLALACSKGATPDIAPIALTPAEYNNTVRDLLGMPDDPDAWPAPPAVAERLSPAAGVVTNVFSGVTTPSAWPWPLPDEIGVDDFDGMVDGQSPSAYQLEELQKAATHFGAYTLVSDAFFTCEDWDVLAAAAQESCAWTSMERFARRAWRRPVTDAEHTRLQAFWQDNVNAGALDEAVALTAAGILQAPQFVYRIEVGDTTKRDNGRITLNDWEMASRLSYFLWDTMPDASLFAAADNGELSSPKGIRTQVARMLEDPRARTAVVRFHNQWLGTDQIAKIAPAQRAYGPVFGLASAPELDTTDDGDWPVVLGGLRTSMEAETHLFITMTLFEGAGSLEALLSDNHGYFSTASQPVYGDNFELLDVDNQSWSNDYVAASLTGTASLTLQGATFPANERAGLLTLPSVLALGSHPVHPSPILRGKRILERVTCIELGSPPPGAEAARPPDIVDAESTNRERTANATSPDLCASCHNQINPAGFAFEHYDSLGRYRTEDNGQPVDGSGSLELLGETLEFSSGVDLARQLSINEAVHDCYAHRWTAYALGYSVDPTDPDMKRVMKDFRKDDQVLGLLEAIATSEMFRFRTLGGGQ